jgi:hypothetical protein
MMSWDSLHEDLLILILANLSLIELARASRTCRSFKAVYGRLMAVEQQSRRDLAVKVFGHERIACLLALITHLLKHRPLGPNSSEEVKEGWISGDGVLHVQHPRALPKSLAGDMSVTVCLNLYRDRKIHLLVRAHDSFMAQLSVRISCDCKHVMFNVFPDTDDDLKVVGMVQAMLTWGLGGSINNAGKYAEICIPHRSERCTRAGLKSQIVPLLPFASRYIPWEEMVGDRNCFEERMLFGQVPSNAN